MSARTATRGVLATMRSAVAEARANRRAVAVQVLVMVVNDAIWLAFWVLFFRRVGTLHGWDVRRIRVLLAVITTAGGIALGLFADARRIGSMAVSGGLDPVLALPVPPLAYLLVRRVEPTNLGDIAFGVVLFAIGGAPTPGRVVMFVCVVCASSVLLTAFLVLTGSLAFFAGRGEGGELGFHSILLFGTYPVDVFAGTARVLLYTVIPAAFVSSVPARLIEHFDAGRAAALGGVAIAFAITAQRVFTIGLRRYTSGSVWTGA